MNLDEETFLTAFLDAELAVEHRPAVEAALLSDPRLAEDLRALTAVRDLVADLSRPAPGADVSALVVARIAGRRSRPFGLSLAGAPASWFVQTAALLATAAAVVVSASPSLRLGPGTGHGPIGRSAPAPRSPSIPEIPAAGGTSPAPSVPVADLPDAAPGPDELRAEADRRLVRNFLDSPNFRSAIIVTDVMGGAERQVGEILESLPRRQSTFGRIVVPQGIIFDPEHPGVTKFFAAVMDDREYRQFQDKLAKAFHEPVEVVTPLPELLTRLSNMDQVAVLPGKPVADLIDPVASAERVRAIRSSPGKEGMTKSRIVKDPSVLDPLQDASHPVIDGEASASQEGPTPEQERSGPHPSLRGRPRNAQPSPPVEKRAPAPLPEQPTSPVVLVYVTSAHKHPSGAR